MLPSSQIPHAATADASVPATQLRVPAMRLRPWVGYKLAFRADGDMEPGADGIR